MIFRVITALLLSAICLLTADAAELKRRTPTAGVRKAAAQSLFFNRIVLSTIQHSMPGGGGYSATPADVERLAQQAVVWSESKQTLSIVPRLAVPTFCSAACYMVLLRSLQHWESAVGRRFPAAVWQELDVTPHQPDGTGIWGRANANGPGLAKMVHDLGVGINFHDVRLAQPGDFLKIFWSESIGATERGHLVIYLGLERKNGTVYLKYWSANKPGGYGVKSAPFSRMHNLIFTRITAPQNFANVTKLPPLDNWLADMQRRSYTFAEVRRKCSIAN